MSSNNSGRLRGPPVTEAKLSLTIEIDVLTLDIGIVLLND